MKNSAKFVLLVLLCFSLGCSYMQNRGRDALDVFDIGFTVSPHWRPDGLLYLDFFSITPLGFNHIDGKFLGIGNRQIGLLDYEQHDWGVLLWGSEKRGAGEFNPEDPHQARADQRELTERPAYNTGLVRMIAQGNRPPVLHFIECQRGLHLGWIGIHVTCRPFDLVDFVLGWTTLDIMGDDVKDDVKE